VGTVVDGETMVIAGLISERERSVRSGVPFLKDLPGLGLLFGHTSREKYNIELVVLLTPTIMDGKAMSEAVAAARAGLDGRR
jgi:general secretion pathway protein D